MDKFWYITLAVFMLTSCVGKSESDKSGVDENEKIEIEDSGVNSDSILGKSEKELAAAEIMVNETEDRAEMTEPVSEKNVVTHIPKNGRPTLLDFSATWCGPCKMMKPIFMDLEDTYDDRMNFVNIDVDDNPELSQRYNITAVPTFIFLDKDGKIVNTITGAVEQAVLENQINRMITK